MNECIAIKYDPRNGRLDKKSDKKKYGGNKQLPDLIQGDRSLVLFLFSLLQQLGMDFFQSQYFILVDNLQPFFLGIELFDFSSNSHVVLPVEVLLFFQMLASDSSQIIFVCRTSPLMPFLFLYHLFTNYAICSSFSAESVRMASSWNFIIEFFSLSA